MHSGMETHGKGRARLDRHGYGHRHGQGDTIERPRRHYLKKGWYLHGEDGQARQAERQSGNVRYTPEYRLASRELKLPRVFPGRACR